MLVLGWFGGAERRYFERLSCGGLVSVPSCSMMLVDCSTKNRSPQ
jgi:hypothetical protein